MKIFNVENNEKCVYVQLDDLARLMHNGDLIAAELITGVYSDGLTVNDSNKWDFMRFSTPHTVSFFESLDWIPDFKKISSLSESEILAYGQELLDERNKIAEEHNNPDTPDEKREELFDRYQLLEHQMNSISEILWVKRGRIKMPFPIVPDYAGFTLENKEALYGAKQGINPLQHLVYRKDGMPFDEKIDTNIPEGLIMGADSLCMMTNSENNEFFGNFNITRSLSEDKKYLITTLNMVVPEEEKEVQKSSESKSLGKRIKNRIHQIGQNIKRKFEEM